MPLSDLTETNLWQVLNEEYNYCNKVYNKCNSNKKSRKH